VVIAAIASCHHGSPELVDASVDTAVDTMDRTRTCSSSWMQSGPIIMVDFASRYGVASLTTIATAIADANAYFTSNPDDTYVIQFAAGTFDLSGETSPDATTSANSAAFNISGTNPGNGHLIIAGAGSASTTFIFNDVEEATSGTGFSHVCFQGMHFAWAHPTVSQGHVVSVSPGTVVLDIAPGFPTPAAIFDPASQQGRYLRQYTDDADPQLVGQADVCSPDQLPWSTASLVGGQRWTLQLDNAKTTAPYPVGALIGIKSKHGTNAGAGFFASGSDLVFEDVLWTEHSRVVFRSGTSDIQILRSGIARVPIAGQTPCLSTPEGGPQFGQPTDPAVTGFVVDQFSADSTGDDSVAFFTPPDRSRAPPS
jgi:hypothetical protein